MRIKDFSDELLQLIQSNNNLGNKCSAAINDNDIFIKTYDQEMIHIYLDVIMCGRDNDRDLANFQ